MNREIERKFLVLNDDFIKEAILIKKIVQGYMLRSDGKNIRIRTVQLIGIKSHKVNDPDINGAYITIKIKNSDDNTIGVNEFEYSIPFNDGVELLKNCYIPLIEKTRYIVLKSLYKWEIDVFKEHKEGLVMAEIELKNENEPFEKPLWLGEEVTGNKDYYNANM